MSDNFVFAGFASPNRVPMFRPGKPLGKRLCTAYSKTIVPILPGRPADGWSFYLDSDFAPGLRWQYADEVAKIRHKGWFCDEHGDQTIRGIVLALPHGRGWLAGWTMGEEMSSCVERGIYDDQEEAGQIADECARIAAEREQEFQAEESARLEAEALEAETLVEQEIMSFAASVRHIDTCLSCYVTDHCNGDAELLIGVPVNGDTTYAEVREGLEREISALDLSGRLDDADLAPLYAAIRAAVLDEFSTVRDTAAPFDASLEVASPDDDESAGELCYAWFRVSWAADGATSESADV